MRLGFTNEESCKRADEIVDFLVRPRMWIRQSEYPDLERWLKKVHAQLKSEVKRALIGTDGARVVAVAIYQESPAEKGVLEVRNLSVQPEWRGRMVASLMLRNAELEGRRDFGCSEAVLDAKADNVAVRGFLLRHGYEASDPEDLYGLGTGKDTLFRKRLVPASR